MSKAIINANRSKGVINRNIYGHFSEHLGRCVYGGLYVGGQSDIPNESGMRTDVVQALRAIGVPVLRWPGGCFADTYRPCRKRSARRIICTKHAFRRASPARAWRAAPACSAAAMWRCARPV